MAVGLEQDLDPVDIPLAVALRQGVKTADIDGQVEWTADPLRSGTLPTWKVGPKARWRARRLAFQMARATKSTPVTVQPRWARNTEVAPVPQPMSRARAGGWSSANWTTSGGGTPVSQGGLPR